MGAVALLYALAQQIGLTQALGPGREASLALWQVIARVIDQGSRLSAVRLARHHCAQELLGLARFDEDDLYANLDWLCENQPRIEQRLFDQHSRQDHGGLFLYDVTSSYLEGEHNELAAFGYNRDGKRGKRQIVIGLLCDAQGTPLCIEVFAGNTQDPKTFAPQVQKVAARFGGEDVTFVGDRGMIKSAQIEALGERGFHYITAITKPQIERLLKRGTFQIGLFDDALAEVQEHGGVRYVLRRNAQRAQEMADTRQDKYRVLAQAVKIQNGYLAEHNRAKPEVALRKLQAHAHKLGANSWLSFGQQERILSLVEDSEALAELSRLDGCYALKTDLPPASAAEGTGACPLQGSRAGGMGLSLRQDGGHRDASDLRAPRDPHARPCPGRHAGLPLDPGVGLTLERTGLNRPRRHRHAGQPVPGRGTGQRASTLQPDSPAQPGHSEFVGRRARVSALWPARQEGQRVHQGQAPEQTKQK